jgi:hypothetical protein
MASWLDDPHWMQAYGNYGRNDYPSSGVAFTARLAAVDEMCAIESAYEADQGLTPPPSFELTPVHDAARCKARRLAAKIAKAEALRAELTIFNSGGYRV